MALTVTRAMSLSMFDGLKLIAGYGGVKNEISNVGILDFEFTPQGLSQINNSYFEEGQFILSSFLYARGNDALILEAVKKLVSLGASGLAIKNIFSLQISPEVIKYANRMSFPIFLFTDLSLYFEDLIISIANANTSLKNSHILEEKINTILKGSYDKKEIKEHVLKINYSFKSSFICIYFSQINHADIVAMDKCIQQIENSSAFDIHSSVIKYEHGFYCILSYDYINPKTYRNTIEDFIDKTEIKFKEYSIGISNPKYYLEDFKNGLQEALYASKPDIANSKHLSFYGDIGVYKLLLPVINEDCVREFSDFIVTPIIHYDIENKSNLLDTAIAYMECNGDLKLTSERQFNHVNTIRYRLNKISQIIDIDINDKTFYEQLFLALRIYKMLNMK